MKKKKKEHENPSPVSVSKGSNLLMSGQGREQRWPTAQPSEQKCGSQHTNTRAHPVWQSLPLSRRTPRLSVLLPSLSPRKIN